MKSRWRRVWQVPLFALLAGLPACGHDEYMAGAFEFAARNDCAVIGQNLTIRSIMRDWYFWYRDMPDADPARSATPEDYLDALRFLPLDRFSYLADAEADRAFFSESQFIGIGIRNRLIAADDLRIVDVFAGSPAEQAGLRRGDRLLEINGRLVSELIANDELDAAFGPAEIGFSLTLRIRRLDGTEVTVTVVKGLVTIPTVALTTTFDVGGATVGYILFENFVQPSFAALDTAFTTLRFAGASEIVLDLRYNGGGLLSVAQYLASLVGGVNTSGRVFLSLLHNDKHQADNFTAGFLNLPNALSANRLVVLTTSATASASEVIINALRPFIDVVVVGTTTFGKPVGQYGFDFCDKVLHPVSFETVNANGEGRYFDGLAPTCEAVDDVTRALGDPQEATLAEALNYLATGQCLPETAARRQALAAQKTAYRLQLERQDGWRQLVGAH